MVGRTIGKYRVVEQIGRGGMGTVYKAIDETLERVVAIKVLNAELLDQESVERFRREAMMLAKLNHGRIGAIHELTRDGQNLLMVMEFIAGDTFEKLVERGPMPVSRASMLCAQVLDALQYAHAAGVVHRDLKPANIILTPSGDVKVMDFGIARVQGSQHLTMSGYMVGTPAYMAPEQVRGEEVDPRMDLYSIAVVLYRLVTQKLPFSGNTTIAMINSQLNSPPTPASQHRADLPDWLHQVLDRGLAKAPADRFQTAAEFRVALESGLAGRTPTSSGIIPIDPDATMPPMATPASMRIPVMPSGTAPSPPSAVAPAASPSAMIAQPAAAQPPKPAPADDGTVTLRAPHFATAGILLVALVVGVGVLAFVALRRQPAAVVPVTVEEVVSEPGTPAGGADTAPPSTSPAAAAGTAAAAAANAPATTGPAATAPRPATPTPPAATTPAANASAPTTPAAGRGATTAGRGAAAPAPPLAATELPTTNTVAAAPAPAPALPAAASAPAENFGDVRTLVIDGTRSREVEALLSLEPGKLIVRSRTDGSTLRTMDYSAIAAATYTRARRPRGQSSPGVADVPENVGGAGLFGGARHWLTLQTTNEVLIIRLEDRNVIRVLTSLEARTGVKIPRTQGA